MGKMPAHWRNKLQVARGRDRINRQRAREKEARIQKLTEMLPGRALRFGDVQKLANALGVNRTTVWRYFQAIKAASLCPCCGQPLPPGRAETSPLLKKAEPTTPPPEKPAKPARLPNGYDAPGDTPPPPKNKKKPSP